MLNKVSILLLGVIFIVSGCGGDSSGGSGTGSLTVSHDTIELTSTSGGITSIVDVMIQSSGGYLLTETTGALSNTSSITITGSNTATFQVSSSMFDTFGSGTYSGTIKVKLCPDSLCVGSVLAEHTISVTLTKTSASVSPSTLSFSSAIGSPAPPSQEITYSDNAGNSYDWTAEVTYQSGSDWLQLSAVNGASLPVQVQLNVLPANLAEGTYNAQIMLRSNAGNNLLTVSYEVTAPSLVVNTASLDFTVTAATSTSELLKQIGLSNTGSAVDWQISSDVVWLSFPTAQGNITDSANVDVQLVLSELANLNNATHSGNIILTYVDRSDVSVSVPVNLSLNTPVVTQVAPHVGFTGQAIDVLIKGEGFNSITGQAVSIGSQTASTVTVVSDTELRITHAGIPLGTHAVSVTDSLGLSKSLDSLVVVDPVTYAYQSVAPTSYIVAPLVYDSVRKAIYTADYLNDKLTVFRYDDVSTNWVESSVTLAGAKGVALSNDGKYLIVTTNETFTSFYRVDPDTLSTISSGDFVLGYNLTLGNIVPVSTGDVLFGTSTGGAILFDPDDDSYFRTATVLTTDEAFSPGELAGSLNGDRVFVGTSFIKFFDLTDLTVVNSSVNVSVEDMATDKEGNRLLINPSDATAVGVYDVSDVDMTLIGSLAANIESIALSPDGNTAYAFDYIAGTPDQYLIKIYDLTTPDGLGSFNVLTYTLPDTLGGVQNVRMTVSADGNTLFLGSSSLIVWPIP